MSARQLADKSNKPEKLDVPPKRRRIGSAARRAQLIEIAEEVFVREGYERASMEQIADEAGVTRTLVYQHFPTKRDLYMAVLDRVVPEFIKRVVPQGEVEPKHPWRILAGFRAFLSMLEDEEGSVKLLLGERPREPWIAERIDQLSGFFCEYFVNLFRGAASDEQIRLLGRCYLGMMENISRVWPEGESHNMSLDEVACTVSNFVWRGLGSLDIPADMIDEQYATRPADEWRPDLEYLEALADQFPTTLRPSDLSGKTE